MINGNKWQLETTHPQSGANMLLEVPLDVLPTLLHQGRTFEQFRMLVLEWNWKERERQRIEAIRDAALLQQERKRVLAMAAGQT